MTKKDKAGVLWKVEVAAYSLILALNGAFFMSIGAEPIERIRAKQRVDRAHWGFILAVSSAVDTLGKEDPAAAELKSDLNRVALKMSKETKRLIANGNPSRAGKILGNDAHGGVGMLIKKQSSSISIRVADKKGKVWSNPKDLMKAIVIHYIETRE